MSKKDTRAAKDARETKDGGDVSDHAYDAIIVGGGHNGLVNGAYLAKSGLRVLILERRHLVGGAAITEELWPGFSFTTFSYALSLLRPDIIHELDLVKHGFMPLLMSSTFAPMENGDYLLIGQDHGVNQREIARHSKHDADAYDRYNHDMNKVLQALKPLLDAPPPNLFSDDPEEMLALAGLGARFKALPKDVLHNTVRLLTGSAADFLDDYFESDILKGYLASSAIIGTKVGPYSQGSGLVLLYHLLGEHDGEFGAWAFHKGGNGGFTQVLSRAAKAFGAEIRLEAPVVSVRTDGGRVRGVALEDGTGVRRAGRRLRARPAADVPRARRPAGAAVRPRRRDRAVPVPGDERQGQLRARRAAGVPGARGPRGPLPRVHQHRAVDGVPRAGVRRGQVRLVLVAAVPRLRRPEHDRRRHGAARQARDVVASCSTRRTTSARATGTRRRRTWATPSSARWSRSSRGSGT